MDVLQEIARLRTGEKIQAVFFMAAFVFMVFSGVGWVLELFFRRFVSAKRWVNPGFLKGPCLPIYGTGVVVMTAYVLLMSVWKSAFPTRWLFDVTVILGSGLLMTLIELVGGLIFIEGMHVRLWDYRDQPGNFRGIICPGFTLIWTAAGAAFYYLLFNSIVRMATHFITLDWFSLAVFFMGMYYGVFVIDFCISVQLIKKIKAVAEESQLILKWENIKLHVQTELRSKKQKPRFLSPFQSGTPLHDSVRAYIREQGEKLEKLKRKK